MREIDNTGDKIEARYSNLILDPSFERRLREFDPRLRLLFDKILQRWIVLERAYDNSGWNIILIAQDENKNPMPLGEWVLNRLYVYRKRWEKARESGVSQWQRELKNEAEAQTNKRSEKLSEKTREKIVDDINIWRRAARAMDNLPISDVTAGYPKKGTHAKSKFSSVKNQAL